MGRTMKISKIAMTILFLTYASTSFADGVVRGKVLRILGYGAGNITQKVEINVMPESSSALPDGSGNCGFKKNGDGVTLYLLASNPQYKSILAILLTGASSKKTAGLDATMNDGSCAVQNAYVEF